MAVDKLVDSTQLDADLTSVANAIRTKGGTSSQLAFPAGFVSAVQDIPTGTTPTLITKTITENGIYEAEDDDADGYSEVTVSVSGGGRVLPSTYTARDYIQTAGDAYIDTGVKEFPTALTGFEGRFAAHNAGTNAKSLWGYAGTNGTNPSIYRFIVTLTTSNGIIYSATSQGDSNAIGGWDANDVNDISVSFTDNATYPVFTINDVVTTGNKAKTSQFNGSVATFYLLARNSNNAPGDANKAVDGSWIRCYGFKIFCYGGVVRDYVPCTRNADGVAGFYDFVTEGFYPSIGENAFTYG